MSVAQSKLEQGQLAQESQSTHLSYLLADDLKRKNGTKMNSASGSVELCAWWSATMARREHFCLSPQRRKSVRETSSSKFLFRVFASEGKLFGKILSQSEAASMLGLPSHRSRNPRALRTRSHHYGALGCALGNALGQRARVSNA